MKLHELMKYLQKENEVPQLDVGKMAESLGLNHINVSTVLSHCSGDKASLPLFQKSNEYKWSLTEEGRKLLRQLNEAEYYLTGIRQ
jgi:predicted transcriptional regulator